MQSLITQSNHHIENSKLMAKFLVFSIPIIVLTDGLFNYGVTNVQLGLFIKAFSVIFFSHYLLLRKIRGFAFNKILLYFLSLNIIYAVFSKDIVLNLYFSVRIAYWVLGAIVVYQLILFDWLTRKHIQQLIRWTLLIASVFAIVVMSQAEEHQNAGAYLLLWCLPISLFVKQTILIRVIQFLAIIAIMITIKRGAMIALLLSIVVYIYGMLKISNRLIGKSKILLLGLFLFGLAMAAVYWKWEAIAPRLEDTGGSGRDVMYTGIIQHYMNGNLIDWLFGFGINSVQEYTRILFSVGPNELGVAAHSDWLQYLHDFGLFGFIFMLILHIKFIQIIKFHKNLKTQYFPILLMSYSIFFLTTIYSFILNTPNAIFLGIILAIGSAEMNKIKYEQAIV